MLYGQVAQSVEQRPEKPCVASSILALSTSLKFEGKFETNRSSFPFIFIR